MLNNAIFRAKKNANFEYVIPYNADFTGSTFLMEIRSRTNDNTAGTLLATLSTANSGIVCDFLPKSTLTFFLARANIPAIGEHDFDVLRIDGDGPHFLFGGTYEVQKGITAAP